MLEKTPSPQGDKIWRARSSANKMDGHEMIGGMVIGGILWSGWCDGIASRGIEILFSLIVEGFCLFCADEDKGEHIDGVGEEVFERADGE